MKGFTACHEVKDGVHDVECLGDSDEYIIRSDPSFEKIRALISDNKHLSETITKADELDLETRYDLSSAKDLDSKTLERIDTLGRKACHNSFADLTDHMTRTNCLVCLG